MTYLCRNRGFRFNVALSAALFSLLSAAGCSDDSSSDTGSVDAATDPGTDSGSGSTTDSGSGSTTDSGSMTDSGTVVGTAVSCTEIFDTQPDASSGTYVIDPGTGPFNVECVFIREENDLDVGAWTVVDVLDFSNYATSNIRMDTWAAGDIDTTSDCASAVDPMLGGSSASSQLSTSWSYDLTQIPHQRVRMEINVVVLDSWDHGHPSAGSDGGLDDDLVRVQLRGAGGIKDPKASNDYSEQTFSYDFPPEGDEVNLCDPPGVSNTVLDRGVNQLVARTMRTGSQELLENLEVAFDSLAEQGPEDESVGILSAKLMVRSD